METLYPFTRRLVAVGLLLLIVLLAVQWLIVPLAVTIVDGRAELAALRAREARLRQAIHRTPPNATVIPPGLVLDAPSQTMAGQRLHSRIAANASTAGVSLQQGEPRMLAGHPHIVTCTVVATGAEAGIANFLSFAEHGAPLLRFTRWRVTPVDPENKTLRFEGLAMMVWTSPS